MAAPTLTFRQLGATAWCICAALALALPACEDTGRDDSDSAGDAPAETEAPRATVRRVSPSKAAEMVRTRPDVVVLDCRPESAYEEKHLPGAVHLNPFVREESLVERLDELERETTYLLYCIKGKRSAEIADRMAGMGFEHVFIVDDAGFEQLIAALEEPPS